MADNRPKVNVNYGAANPNYSVNVNAPGVYGSTYGGAPQPYTTVNRDTTSSYYQRSTSITQGATFAPTNSTLAKNNNLGTTYQSGYNQPSSQAQPLTIGGGLRNTGQYSPAQNPVYAQNAQRTSDFNHNATTVVQPHKVASDHSEIREDKGNPIGKVCFGLLGLFALAGLILGILFGVGVIGSNRTDIVATNTTAKHHETLALTDTAELHQSQHAYSDFSKPALGFHRLRYNHEGGPQI